jgi:hypothetical protein
VLVRNYEEVRRIVTYLRWYEGDADAIAPSLFAHRAGRRRRAQPREVAPDAPPVATDPEPSST